MSRRCRTVDSATTHAYKADSQSGAGNCVCGASERHRRHPHDYVRAYTVKSDAPVLCTCGLPREAAQHLQLWENESQDRPAGVEEHG